VVRGVPQESILVPLLWNIAYDYVLRISYQRRPGCSVIGYADDILVLCFASFVEVAQSNINFFIDYVLRRIEFLSLEVVADKTEAVLFRGSRRLEYTNPLVRVRGSCVRASPHIKYLGMILDSRLNFKQHFQYLDNKIGKITRALGKLMPNLRGPQERKRKLYAGIIESVVVYAAPIWADSLTVDEKALSSLRAIAVRVCVYVGFIRFGNLFGSAHSF